MGGWEGFWSQRSSCKTTQVHGHFSFPIHGTLIMHAIFCRLNYHEAIVRYWRKLEHQIDFRSSYTNAIMGNLLDSESLLSSSLPLFFPPFAETDGFSFRTESFTWDTLSPSPRLNSLSPMKSLRERRPCFHSVSTVLECQSRLVLTSSRKKLSFSVKTLSVTSKVWL